MVIAGYRLLEQLHESARTSVWRAVRQVGEPPIVLKIAKGAVPALQQLATWNREFDTLRLLDFPGVPRAQALETDLDRPILVLEDIGGSSLARLLAQQQPDLGTFLAIAVEAAGHLHEVHRRGVVHQDLRPANLVFNPATGRLQIIDFGLAARGPGGPPASASELDYISPEQTGRMNRAHDYRTDFYSLGATFYHLLTGRPPFVAADRLELIHCHIARQPQPPQELNPLVPPMVSRIVMKLLAKAPADRYQSGAGLAADLSRCRAEWGAAGSIAAFDLGSHDLPDRLQHPQQLYGRGRELQALREACTRVGQGGRALVLVAGYSGIGKSSLVRALRPHVVHQGGYFIAGKFDQQQQRVPYRPLIQAFTDLARQLLTGDDAALAGWRRALGDALGPNGRVITELIPDMERIVGPQPALPAAPAAEALQRFQRVFLRFCRALARPEHQLVLFLDDLQWADVPTLNLLELLAGDEDLEGLLAIGAYRDHEVGPAHALTLSRARIEQRGGAVVTLALQPLNPVDLASLLAGMFCSAPERAMELAEVLQEKTHGNPFFVNELLSSLYDQGLIRLDAAARAWTWDLAAIRRRDVTGNVAALMAARIGRVAEPTRRALRLAACIGNRFDLATLAIVHEGTPAELLDDLREALQQGLIQPAGGGYRFLHDQVQQAAYALIAADRRQEVHLAIGWQLLAGLPPGTNPESLFEIVDHLNIGAGLVRDEPAREQLLRLNLAAARRARQSVAFASARGYLQAGLALLRADAWASQYELALELHLESAEAAYLAGEFPAMERLIGQVLEHARALQDKVRAHLVRSEALAAANRHAEAVATGRDALELLGVRLPRRPGRRHVLLALLRTRWALAGKSPADLARLPPMADPGALAAMQVLAQVTLPAYLGAPDHFPLIVLKQVALSARYGHAPTSALAYAVYGVMLVGPIGDSAAGYRMGELALEVQARYGAGSQQSRVQSAVFVHARPAQDHVRASLQPLQEAYRSGLEVGDFESAAIALFSHALYAYCAGCELTALRQEMAAAGREIKQLRQVTALLYCRIWLQSILNLTGPAEDPAGPDGAVFAEQELAGGRDRPALFMYYLSHMQLAFLFGRPGEAEAMSRLAEPHLDPVAPAVMLAAYYFYDSLIQLAMCRAAPRLARRPRLARVRRNQRKLARWARHAPMNFRHKLLLVAAELAGVEGRDAAALRGYEQAIDLARDNQFVQDQAVGAELAAGFYRERGAQPAAASYLAVARLSYARWGATAKVRDLEARFPNLLALPAAAADASVDPAIGDTPLDVGSLLQAAQAISGEIRYESLLRKLMRIAVVNAGAGRGCLLVQSGDELLLMAEHEAGREQVAILPPAALEAEGPDGLARVPAAIARLVAHTLQPLVLDDAAAAETFAADPYVASRQPRSVLCVPLLYRGGLAGVLYLENNLTPGAFTARRLQVLQYLSAQMAISISNAALYRDLEHAQGLLEDQNRTLEQQVRARTAEAEQANRLLQEQMEQREQLLRDVSHELRSPLARMNVAAGLMAAKDSVQPYVGEIRIDMREMEALIDEILVLLRTRAARSQDLERVDLAELAAALAAQRRHLIAEHGLRLATGLQPALVLGDRRLLARAVGNVLDNAIKYTPSGGAIRLAVAEEREGCAVRVEDDGPGIPSEHLPNICQPFYRADASRSRATGGSGLGLAIARAVVESLQGKLRIESVLGQGTRVEMWFPHCPE